MQCTSADHKGRKTPDGKVLRQIEENGLTREFDYQANFTRVTDNEIGVRVKIKIIDKQRAG